MKTALVIPHYHATRRNNISHIIQSTQSWTRRPDEIIIFNNNRDYKMDILGAKIINSAENYGSIARYGIALISRCDQFVFQDDDLMLGPTAFAKLTDALERHPDSVVGMIGGNWQAGKSYTQKQPVTVPQGEAEAPCQFVLGRVTSLRRPLLARCFLFIEKYEQTVGGVHGPSWCHEDIPMSFAVTQAGESNYLIPRDFQELDAGGVGLEHKPDHYEIRDKLAQTFLNVKVVM